MHAGDALITEIVEAVARTSTPQDALGSGMRSFFQFLAADRDAWRVLFDESVPSSGKIAARVGDYRERLTALVTQALLGQLPPARRAQEKARVELEALSLSVLAAAEAMGRWWLRTDAVTPDRAAELLIATLGPGLRDPARPAGRSRSAGGSTAGGGAAVA